MKFYYPKDKNGNRIGFKTPETQVFDSEGVSLADKMVNIHNKEKSYEKFIQDTETETQGNLVINSNCISHDTYCYKQGLSVTLELYIQAKEANANLIVIPEGFRPAHDISVLVPTSDGNVTTLTIATNGTVRTSNIATIRANLFYYVLAN